MDPIILTIVTCVLVWILIRRDKAYFENRGVKSTPYTVPFLGNAEDLFARKRHFKDVIRAIYTDFPKERYVGFSQLCTKQLFIRDPELLKRIAIKDFDHFVDHAPFINQKMDPLFGHNLFSLRGDKWRDMRSTISPAFTASKIKAMFHMVDDCARNVVHIFGDKLRNNTVLDVELRDMANRYTSNAIGTTAFGLDIDCFTNEYDQLFLMGKEASNFSGLQQLKLLFFVSLPKFMDVVAPTFGISVVRSQVNDFFKRFVLDAMNQREALGVVRPDMIHQLIEAKNGVLKGDNDDEKTTKRHKKREWSDDELVAQLAVFFIGGFDTTSTLLSFGMHELATNPECQRKLQTEIDDFVGEDLDRIFRYDDLASLKYLEMVVAETLRKWPPALMVDRQCSKPYKLPPPNDTSSRSYQLNKGDVILIPIYAIHQDPIYYPNPDTFDPERFSEDNKTSLNPSAYMPFGIGPRNCIGQRLALMIAKIMLFHTVKNFELVATPKTQSPLKIANDSPNFQAQNGIWVGFKLRK